MGLTIKDGKGRGFEAGVGDDNKLQIMSTNHTEEHSVAVNSSETYFANTADAANTLTTVSPNTYNLLYIKNNSSIKMMVVEKILISASAAGGVVKWLRNPVLGTIGSHKTHLPVNTNFSSGKIADALCYTWDEVGTTGLTGFTNGTTIKTFITNVGPNIFPIDGMMILKQGNSLLIAYTPPAAGAEVECGIRCYWDIPEQE